MLREENMRDLLKPFGIFTLLILLASCSTTSSRIELAHGGVIEYTKNNYLNMFTVNPISLGFQKIKPTYSIEKHVGYTTFNYYFEVHNQSKIFTSYQEFCESNGYVYHSSNWKIVCREVSDSNAILFFVDVGRVRGYYNGSKYVDLYLYESENPKSGVLSTIRDTSDYESPEALEAKREEKRKSRMADADARRIFFYKRTPGTKLCKGDLVGYVDGEHVDKIKILLINNTVLYDYPENWSICQ